MEITNLNIETSPYTSKKRPKADCILENTYNYNLYYRIMLSRIVSMISQLSEDSFYNTLIRNKWG